LFRIYAQKGCIMNIRRFAAAAALALGAGASHANTTSLFSFTLTELRDVSISVSSPGGTIVSFAPLFTLTSPAFMSAPSVTPSGANLSFFDLGMGTYQVELVTTMPGSYSIGGSSAVFDPVTGGYTSLANVTLTPVPEADPASLALAGVSVLGLIASRRRMAA
jgi:hypothetical protein